MAIKVAIIGGSFNPIHNGHLALADAVIKQLHYDKVYFIPAFCSPHKKKYASESTEDRLNMVKLAIKDNPFFEVETCELEREGISYTLDTIEYLYSKYNSICGKIGLVIGDDLAKNFNTWKNPTLLAKKSDIIVAHRVMSVGNFDLGLECFKHKELKNSVLPISSSRIRTAIQQNEAWRYLVPPAVYNYIKAKELYGKRNEASY